jgi:VanZ family protein
MWVRAFGPPLIWMGLIFYLSSLSTLPAAEVIWWDFIVKKFAHMFEFAVLFYLWQRALKIYYPSMAHPYVAAFVITVLYAISDELHQSVVPGRHAKAMDVGYDAFGAMSVWLKMKKFI